MSTNKFDTIKFDSGITTEDIWLMITQELSEKGLVAHAIDSMNDLYDVGIDQIITKVFSIENILENTRDKTPEDRAVKRIWYKVTFENVSLRKPVTAGYCSGKEKILLPVVAGIEDRNLVGNLDVDAHIQAKSIDADGNETLREARVKNFRLTNIPVMVRSKLCHTAGKSRETLTQLHEDPDDSGAYFIKNGKSWSIDSSESTAFNVPRIFNNAWQNERQRLELISKPGDTYQNSKQTIIRYLNSDALTVEIVITGLHHVQFPFYLIFRALGWSTDRELFDNVMGADVTDRASHDEVFGRMCDILAMALTASYDTKQYSFSGGLQRHTQAEVLEFIVRHMPREAFKELDMVKEEHLQQAILRFLRHIDEDLLPHLGMDEAARPAKARFLADMFLQMLYVHLNLMPQTDRDSYLGKRVHTPGTSTGKTIKTNFNASIVNPIKRTFNKDFRAMSFKAVDLARTFQISVNGTDFERQIMSSITSSATSGGQQKPAGGRQTPHRVSSQLLELKNPLKALSTIRNITTPNGDSNKSSMRAKDMRMPHQSFQGYICFVQSADSGEKVGMQKQLACSAGISSYGSSELLKQFVLAKKTVTPTAAIHPYNVRHKVFVNGDWIGCVDDDTAFITEMTNDRRYGRVDKYMTIEWNNILRRVYLWVDFGRPIRPVVIVYNNIRDWKELGLKGPAKAKDFRQATGLTAEIMAELRAGKLTMADLLRRRVVEYLTPPEQFRMYVAADPNHLREHSHDPLHQFTHVDCPRALLGIAALTCPGAHHNQTTRNTFQTAQIRQAGSWYCKNWAYRIDKDCFLQYQGSWPLAQTCVTRYLGPLGSMCIVAVACYTGFNEEDSTVWNKVTGEYQKFVGSWFTYDKLELEKNERFCNPDTVRTMGIKNYANYSKLGKNGIIPVGTIVKKGDVVIGKTKKLPKNIAEEKKKDEVDQSLVYKLEFPAIVHCAVISKDDEGTTFCKVGYRSIKPIVIGDKWSARCFTPDHEVLTRDSGWVPIAEVDMQDLVATLDTATGEMRYEHPAAIRSYDIDEDMLEVDNCRVAFKATMDHRHWVNTTTGCKGAWATLTSRELLAACTKKDGTLQKKKVCFSSDWKFTNVPDQATWTVPGVGVSLPMDEWLDFLGLYISEGNILSGTSVNGFKISAHKQRVKDLLTSAEKGLGWTHRSHGGSDNHNYWYYCNPDLVGYLESLGQSTKKYLPEWCMSLSQRQSLRLLTSLVTGDGTFTADKNGETLDEYYTGSKYLAKDIQVLGFNAGYICSARVKKPAGEQLAIKGVNTVRSTDQWRVRFTRSTCTKRPAITPQEMKVVKYKGPVHCLTMPLSTFYVRRKSVSGENSGTWSQNSGQKGICGLSLPTSDMPYTESGVIPDIIINPHGFPSRMTVGHDSESCLGKVCARTGTMTDMTIFSKVDPESVMERMREAGLEPHGCERLYCGYTGAWMDSLIFMGPMYYQRLQKFVSKSVYSIDIGPTDVITRQPLNGKANDGGLRISELQRDVMLAHGCARYFSEKFFGDSDDFDIHLCRCESVGITNPDAGIYECKNCGEDADIYTIRSCWASQIAFKEMNAINIGTRFRLAPFTFYEPYTAQKSS